MIDLSEQNVLVSGGPPTLRDGISRSMQGAGAAVQTLETTENPNPDTISDRLAGISRIDTMVILPSYYTTGLFLHARDAEWEQALQANYEHGVYLAQAAAQHMIQRKVRGSIIFVSSVAIQQPQIQTSVLATSLAPLYPLAKMAAVTCGPYGIRVNTVAIAWLNTEWHNRHLRQESDREYVQSGIPLGHIGEASDVGDVCCFLASPLARYITGGIIPVDGGYSLTRSDGSSPYPSG